MKRSGSVPRHVALRRDLMDRIDGGEYGPGDRIPPELKIAELFGVSRMTANKAILSLVADGRLVRHKRRGTFVAETTPTAKRPVVVVDQLPLAMEDDYFQGLFWSLQRELAANGVGLQTVGMATADRAQQFAGLGADPLVLIGPNKTLLADILEAASRGTRIVVLGASWQGPGITAVDSDNMLGAAYAVNHLADLGHRSIGFLGAFPNASNTVDRFRGFKTAIAARGLPFRSYHAVVSGVYLDRDPGGRHALELMLSRPDRPTALFAAGGHLPFDAIGVARSLGLNVPDDLSIVGYDDPPFASRCSPPLTTVRQPFAQMAAEAARIVLNAPGAGRAFPPYQAFEPELVVRASTAKV